MTSSQLAGEWIFYDRSQHGVGHDEAAFSSSLELVGQYAEGIGVAFEVSDVFPKCFGYQVLDLQPRTFSEKRLYRFFT